MKAKGSLGRSGHNFPNPQPDRDAFASARNALCPAFWSADDDALSQRWLTSGPLWMNTPFTLLHAGHAKFLVEGGNIVLICPDWAPELATFRALCSKSVSFGGIPLFLREGRDPCLCCHVPATLSAPSSAVPRVR